MGPNLSAPSPSDDLRSKVCDSFTRSNCTQRFFLGNRLRFLCGNDTVAVAMHFAMKNGKFCFSLRKFLAISPAIQKIASDCGCDAVVHLEGRAGDHFHCTVEPSPGHIRCRIHCGIKKLHLGSLDLRLPWFFVIFLKPSSWIQWQDLFPHLLFRGPMYCCI